MSGEWVAYCRTALKSRAHSPLTAHHSPFQPFVCDICQLYRFVQKSFPRRGYFARSYASL